MSGLKNKDPRSGKELLVLCFATFLVMTGQGVVGPVVPLYARGLRGRCASSRLDPDSICSRTLNSECSRLA